MRLLALKYALRDLRSGFSWFFIFLICIMLSVAVIGGVQSLSYGIKESIRNDGRLILGGDISLSKLFEPASAEQLQFLKERMGPTTAIIETRSMARRTDGTKSSLVELKGVDPFYPLYGKIVIVDDKGQSLTDKQDLQELLLPPHANQDKWGAVVEKELLSRLNLKLGEKIEIGKKRFEIRGVITTEPDRVGGKQFTIAPRVMISNYAFNDTGLAVAGSQVEYAYKVLLPDLKNFDDLKKSEQKIEQAFPKADWKGRNFLNASPRAERMIDRLTMFLTFTGLATLMIAGIGIANAVNAFLENKIADIAALKCLGAKENMMLKIYMAEVSILATIGIVGGLILSIVLSQLAGQFITARLAISDSVGFYPRALASSAALGYLITFCASLWPIGRAIKTPAANLFRDLVMPHNIKPSLKVMLFLLISVQALALLALTLSENKLFMAYFIGGVAGAIVVFFTCSYVIKFLIKKIHVTGKPELRMALANLYRPGNMTSSVVLSIGLGLTVLIAVALVQDNFTRMLGRDLAQDAPSFFFLDIQPDQLEKFKTEVGEISSARALKITPSFRGRIMKVNGVDAEKALVDKNEKWVISSDRGFTYTDTLPGNSEIIEGKWWEKDYKGAPLVSISTNVQKAFDIGVGAKLSIRILGRDIEATVANVREVSWGSFTMNFATTFSPNVLETFPGTYIATTITAKDDEEKLQNALASQLPNVTSIRVSDVLRAAEKIITTVAMAVGLSAGITLVAGVLVLAGGIASARKRYAYDAVVLKVLGATKRRIIKTFIFEYSLLAAVTILVASALGSIAAYGIQGFMIDVRWAFNWKAVAIISLLCLCVTMLAGAWGTWHVLKQKPAHYLRNE